MRKVKDNSKEEVKEEDEGNRLLEFDGEGEEANESGEKVVVVDFEFGTVTIRPVYESELGEICTLVCG